jgi:hypothetical protein
LDEKKMGFGKTLKQQKFFENQRTVCQTRQQHQRGQYSKKSSVNSQLFLNESQYSHLSINSFGYAFTGNSRSAKMKQSTLLTSRKDNKSFLNNQNILLQLSSKYFENKPFFGKQDRERKLMKKIREMGNNSKNKHLNSVNCPISKCDSTKYRKCQIPINKNFSKNFNMTDNFTVKNQLNYNIEKINFFDKNFNINIKKCDNGMDLSQQEKNNLVLQNLFSNNRKKELPKLYKLSGTDTRSIKAVHQALITYFKLPKNKIGGISLFEGFNYWVFFAYPSDIEGLDKSLNYNKFNVQIIGWTQNELMNIKTRLAIYANNIGKNKKEYNFVKQAAKTLINNLELNNNKALESIIFIIQNLNKENLNYSVFNTTKNKLKTKKVLNKNILKKNLLNNSKRVHSNGNLNKKIIKNLLIIPDELWDEKNYNARNLFIEQNKSEVLKTSDQSDVKLNKNGLPRKPNPRKPC